MLKKLASRVLRSLHPPIIVSEEYVDWLCFANAGMFDRGNLYCFDYAIKNLPSGAPILEIGSFCGLSTNLLTHYMRLHNVPNRLITCDKWEFENASHNSMVGNSSISHSEYKRFVKESYLRNVRMFSGLRLPHTIEMTSDEFFAAWQKSEQAQDVFECSIQLGGPISFCYIDGNHSYEYAKRDFENCDAVLEHGGFLLFDDSADGTDWDVCQVITEIKFSRKYDVVIKNPNYLLKKI